MTTLKTKTQLHENLQNLWNRDLRPVKQHRGRIKKGCVHFAQDLTGFFLWLFTTYSRIGQWTQADWRKLNSRKVRWLSPQQLKQAKWENIPAEVTRKFSKKQHCALAKDKVFASHPTLASLLHFADAIQHFDTLPDLTPFTAGQKQALTELFKPKPGDTPKPHIPDDRKPKRPNPNICDLLPHAPDKGKPKKPALSAAGQRMVDYRQGKKTLTPADIRLNIKRIEDPRPTINPNKIDSFEHLFKHVTQSTTINLNHPVAPRVIHDFLKDCSKEQTEGIFEWLKKHTPTPLPVIVEAMDAVKGNGVFQDLHPAIPLLLQLYIDSKVTTAQHDPLFGVLLAIEIEKKRNDNTTAAHTLWMTQRNSFSFEQCCQLLESFMTKELENPRRNIVYHARDHLLTVFQAKKWSSKLAHSSPTFICWLHTKQIPIPKEILDPAFALYRGEREKLAQLTKQITTIDATTGNTDIRKITSLETLFHLRGGIDPLVIGQYLTHQPQQAIPLLNWLEKQQNPTVEVIASALEALKEHPEPYRDYLLFAQNTFPQKFRTHIESLFTRFPKTPSLDRLAATLQNLSKEDAIQFAKVLHQHNFDQPQAIKPFIDSFNKKNRGSYLTNHESTFLDFLKQMGAKIPDYSYNKIDTSDTKAPTKNPLIDQYMQDGCSEPEKVTIFLAITAAEKRVLVDPTNITALDQLMLYVSGNLDLNDDHNQKVLFDALYYTPHGISQQILEWVTTIKDPRNPDHLGHIYPTNFSKDLLIGCLKTLYKKAQEKGQTADIYDCFLVLITHNHHHRLIPEDDPLFTDAAQYKKKR